MRSFKNIKHTLIRSLPVIFVLATTCILGFLAATRLPEVTTNWMIRADVVTQAEVWSRRILSRLHDGEATFVEESLALDDVRFMKTLPDTSDIYRMKMFNADGKVFWATRKTDIGHSTASAYFSQIVGHGDIYTDFHFKTGTELNQSLLFSSSKAPATLHRVAEIYVPVIMDGRFVGAIEFYRDITEIHDVLYERVSQALQLVSIVLVALVLLATGTLLRNARRQLRIIEEKNDHEREALEKQMQMAREVGLLSDLNEWLQSSRSLAELFDMVGRFMTHMLPECEGAIYVYSNSRDVLDGAAAWNGGTFKGHVHPDECWGLRRGRTYVYGANPVEFVCEHVDPDDGRPYFCFPILAHGETVGLMHLTQARSTTKEAFFETRKLAQMSAEQISMAIANVRMRDQLEEQSTRDPLTGLFNRRYMFEKLRRILTDADSKRKSVHMVYVDVDHFKSFNDTHGHDAGDMVLRMVGESLSELCINEEFACRMGGEEFMLVWPHLEMSELKDRVALLLTTISDLKVRYGEKILPKITISAGVASYPDHGKLAQDLLKVADAALYEAKDNGRNQAVYAYDPKPVPPSLAAE